MESQSCRFTTLTGRPTSGPVLVVFEKLELRLDPFDDKGFDYFDDLLLIGFTEIERYFLRESLKSEYALSAKH